MGFLSPWLLLGGLAVSVPLVLHFFYRARYRKLPWAAMTFLKQSIEQTSRRLRFQEFVLLLLRCAALLLLALALARPTFSGATAGGRGESVDAIFIFDTSYSMTARDGEKTRLERAKDAAATILDNLPGNSTIQIIGCADRAVELGPQSPRNLDQARQIVANLEPTALATDLLPGLTEAYAGLDRGAGTNKEVYVFTDMHKLGWDRQSAAIRGKCEELKQRATLLLVRCGNPERPIRNVGITSITYPNDIPHTGTRMPCAVLLRNTGKESVRNVTVALEVDGKQQEKESETVPEIAPGQAFPVNLTAKLDAAGPRVLTATVTGDDLPGDNRLDRIVSVRETVRVVIVDGRPDFRDPKESAGHYVRNAILPVKSSDVDNYFIRVEAVPADEAGPALLGNCDVCFLLDVPASNADRPGIPGLSREFVDRLSEFVKSGGGLIIGSGENIVPARYNQILGSGGVNLLPFDLEGVSLTTPEKPFKIAPETTDVPSYLERFQQEPFRTVTADADLSKVLNVKPAATGRVLMRLADQKPFLCSRTVGDGEVIFIAGSMDDKWGNWPSKTGSFLSFIDMTLTHFSSKAARGANVTAGDPIVWTPLDATKNFDLMRPDGKRVKLGKASGVPPVVTASDTPLAGVYRILADNQDVKAAPQFCVSPNLSETDDLTDLTNSEVEQILGFKPVFLEAGTPEGIATERAKREWTVWVLLALFALALGESVWAWFCGKAW
ncbi:BatA domain-containing protein [Limnoglobus roseus]|uniref:VWA domain-containing protein n=1 Tax=Limnoglobus roseus TaxID=2598579 RepID=A0A5C1AG71_9BACT|nr:BatA domain-containing protein [Limnoglobus roseus]QEL18211.1 VWA domain-containing protein [Limnoglobus roseus]